MLKKKSNLKNLNAMKKGALLVSVVLLASTLFAVNPQDVKTAPQKKQTPATEQKAVAKKEQKEVAQPAPQGQVQNAQQEGTKPAAVKKAENPKPAEKKTAEPAKK